MFEKGRKSKAFVFKVTLGNNNNLNSRLGGRLKGADDGLRKSSNAVDGFRTELPDAMRYRQYKLKKPKIR